MAGRRGERVERPTKKSEYLLMFASADAAKGWRDLCGTTGNAMADAWDYLTKTPDASRPPHGQLKGRYATVTRGTAMFPRWQYELPGGARIWYWIVPPDSNRKTKGVVYLERVTPHHPNETK